MPQKRRRSPAEKKALSYAKDRRNNYGENDKAARKSIPLNKAKGHRADRRKATDALSRYKQMDDDQAALTENALLNDLDRYRRWRKSPDQPLGEFIKDRERWRKGREGRKARSREREPLWDEETYLSSPGKIASGGGIVSLPMRAILPLIDVATALRDAQDPWWIIGSAAVALHGGDPGTIADIDVITSRRDLDTLYERLPLSNTPDTSKSMFRSELFGLWSEPELEVEFMTGLEVQVDGEWRPVHPKTRQAITVAEYTLYVPEKAELIEILQQFGRQKDLARAATLTGD